MVPMGWFASRPIRDILIFIFCNTLVMLAKLSICTINIKL